MQHKADGWARVAKFMGDGLSARQCYDRWNNHLEPLKKGLNRRNYWQPHEVPHPYCCYCSNLYRHLTAQSLLLVCLYMTGAALAGAGATA